MGAIIWPDPEHMFQDHGVTVAEAEEALRDPDAIELTPDPASRSGKSSRVIGYSTTRSEVLCVILVHDGGEVYGANGWVASARWRRVYEEKGRDDGEDH